MVGKFGLRTKLLAAFILLGITVLVVAYIGWQSTSRLARDINNIDGNIEGIIGIRKIYNAVMQLVFSEHILVNSRLNSEYRQKTWEGMTKAIALIEEGQREYESTPHGPEEERLYKQFIRDLKPGSNIMTTS